MSPTRWWRGRTLHARLAVLVAGAVAAAVVVIAVLAWLAVAEIQRHDVDAQLNTAARLIAAQPDQWLDQPGPPRMGDRAPDRVPGGGRPAYELGPRWQVLDRTGTVRGIAPDPLPVTPGAVLVAAGHQRPVQERVTVGDDEYVMISVPASGGGAVQVAVDTSQQHRSLVVLALLLAAGCVLGSGGAALLGRAVARAGLKPVERLTEAVEQVAVTMDLARPVAAEGADEIARLGRSVNTMLAAIDSARRAQRALVEDASHELRTPLTSIRTNVELLLQVERRPELAHRLPPQDRAKLLADLDSQVTELATLTTELVELAREEATREATEELDLTDVVTAAIGRVRRRAPGLTFTTDLTPAVLLGRPAELERMIVNILDNAAKWSPAGGVVHTVLSVTEPGWCQVVVSDTGPGIAEADLPYVFDRFYRADAARSMPGSGLGLAIVAQTAARHGGSVSAERNSPHGTRITIRLPQNRTLH